MDVADQSGWTSYMMSDTCVVVLEAMRDEKHEDIEEKADSIDVKVTAPLNFTEYGEEVTVEEYVTNFYSRYNPSKLGDVPHILGGYY